MMCSSVPYHTSDWTRTLLSTISLFTMVLLPFPSPRFHISFRMFPLLVQLGAKSITIEKPTIESLVSAIGDYKVSIARLSKALLAQLATNKSAISSLRHVIVDAAESESDAGVETAFKKNYPQVSL